MPDLPSPYVMRDWKDVTVKYDQFIFNTSATGEYLPFIGQKANGVNYPSLQPILLDTYVGSPSITQAEAINILPAIVGASLAGIDKSNQNGVNWSLKAKEFFNKANGQNVYLNGYATNSGHDWWYDVMPNVYFYQLYSQYPGLADFDEQFTTVADRWLAAVHALGGNATPWTVPQMNYRGINLLTMVPNENGVKEPESAGTISWLLYHAYQQTGNKKYLEGAQMAMEFLSNLTTSPSYELQLPYGTLIASKMNAELGTAYDIEKMVNWNFDRGPLRGWGAIVGTWNGADVSGLIGEANDNGNDYAFIMNGFQHAAALVPMVKYDKRFARAIAKWTLNLANASRLFYRAYLPETSQDDFAWSATHDPESVIAYEALKENINGKHLYATGDAKAGGWAQTNLSLYSSSSVGYLAAVVNTTDVEGILLLDVNKTDFFSQQPFPSYLAYNPHSETKVVTLSLGAQSYDIYDALSETVLKTSVTGNTTLSIPADEAVLLVYLPANSTPIAHDGKLYVNTDIVDYHYGYDFSGKLRIKSLTVANNQVEFNQQVPVYSTIENATGAVTYNWYIDNALVESSPTATFTWSVPEAEGTFELLLEIISGTASAKDSINLTVFENIPSDPVIDGFTTNKWAPAGSTTTITCNATNGDGGLLTYHWTVPSGAIDSQDGASMVWRTPVNEGIYLITCEVTNEDGLTTSEDLEVLVKNPGNGTTTPFAYYPLDGSAQDYSGNDYHGVISGAQMTADQRGQANRAYKFSVGSNIIYIDHKPVFNFQPAITLSCWVKLDAVTEESFIVSHGSWEERWKLSVTPTRKLRWTVKTANGTTDLDSSFPLALNQFYHFTVTYTGYAMELYVDGELDSFLPATGLMSTTTKAITFGRKDVGEENYFLKGTLDEVRIYNKALGPEEVQTLKTLWTEVTAAENDKVAAVMVYPNPARGNVIVKSLSPVRHINVIALTGMSLDTPVVYDESENHYRVELGTVPGIFIIRIETPGGIAYRKIVVE